MTKRIRNILLIGTGGILLVAAAIGLYPWYRSMQAVNIRTPDGNPFSVYLRPGDQLEELMAQLKAGNVLLREADFLRAAQLMQYGPELKPGHYLIRDSINNREALIPLRLGQQQPIRLTLSKYRNIGELSGRVAKKLWLDSADLSSWLGNPDSLATVQLTLDNRLAAFLPDTYEFWWLTDSRDFVERMLQERQRFWERNNRLALADSLGLSPDQVAVVASIVVEEQNAIPSEWPRIAGLYLNRIAIGMPLEADPTIKFAMGRFDLQRVLLRYIDETASSPYNTYRNAGLPPGPICTPYPAAIDAVLNAEEHDFLFMCANADFSGYHAFAKTHTEHLRNRSLYTAALNRRNIR